MISNSFNKNSFYLIDKEINFEYDKVIKFINEYNGKPNIKSYLNVFSNISKKCSMLKVCYKIDFVFLVFGLFLDDTN